MKKILILFSILPFLGMAQEKRIKIIEPIISTNMKVTSFGCDYIDEDMYLVNKDFVVYENCNSRKVLHPDMKSFRFPKHNERGFFALDKNGVYFRGEKIKTDTTGFKIIGRNNNYENPEVLWKIKDAVYKNNKTISVSDVETFQVVECFNGYYFKDKNYVYYFDKMIENSDGSSVQKSCNEFTFDKNNAYLKGEIITYKNEKIIPVNDVFLKTSTFVLTRNNDNFTIHPNVDTKTLRGLSRSYSVDDNNAYYGTAVLPVKKENLKNVKVWDQVNRAYLSDGEKVYSRDNDLKNNFDAKTFGMLPHSDFCFDKNGVYEREWIEADKKVIYVKFPFKYNKPISEDNLFITDDSRYIVYENQAYDPWDKKLYENLTSEQINQAKENKLRLDKVGNSKIEVDETYDYLLYKSGNTIYWDGKKTIADAGTFGSVNGVFYKDAKNVYNYSRGVGLQVIDGLDKETLEPTFNGFLKDKNFLYHYHHKIIKSKNIELLGIFTGYRKGCSQDRSPGSNYYLFKNIEGYWLVQISDNVTIRNLGNKLPNQQEWIPNLKQNFEN
ncbi:DKNYY domain-containing protein [Epilithonimonas xixisoli]|uniref:DKNYY family protein n=1 Tax=Epilithonimonas xixisoli TaxID=1476462 RepID=A0A4R8IKB0_9FLAO|nr:DKNYY domain-containing protein [Epilithonimonas xixisoli]TDX87089.1 DKNYY family protein [Epilithonimonas xixisoli]